MQDKEKSLRMAVLRKQVQENDIYKWISDIIREILRSCAGARKECAYLFDHLGDIKATLEGRPPHALPGLRRNAHADRLFAGTRRYSPVRRGGLIAKLKEAMSVAIISGRSLMDTKERVGIEEPDIRRQPRGRRYGTAKRWW